MVGGPRLVAQAVQANLLMLRYGSTSMDWPTRLKRCVSGAVIRKQDLVTYCPCFHCGGPGRTRTCNRCETQAPAPDRDLADISLCVDLLTGELRTENHVSPVIVAVEGVRWEEPGGTGAAIGIDAIAAGGGAGWRRQHTTGDGGGEEVGGRHISAGRVVRRDVGRVGGDGDGRRQVHRLPAASPDISQRRL